MVCLAELLPENSGNLTRRAAFMQFPDQFSHQKRLGGEQSGERVCACGCILVLPITNLCKAKCWLLVMTWWNSYKNERKVSHLSHCDLNFSSWKSAGCNEVTHEFLGAEFSRLCVCMLVLC